MKRRHQKEARPPSPIPVGVAERRKKQIASDHDGANRPIGDVDPGDSLEDIGFQRPQAGFVIEMGVEYDETGQYEKEIDAKKPLFQDGHQPAGDRLHKCAGSESSVA